MAAGAVAQALATIVLVIVTWVYVNRTRDLATQAEDQAESARKALSASARPVLMPAGFDIGWNDRRSAFWMKSNIYNLGNGPALNGRMWLSVMWIGREHYQQSSLTTSLNPIVASVSASPEVANAEFSVSDHERAEWYELAQQSRANQPHPRWGFDVEFDDIFGDRFLVEFRPHEEVTWTMRSLVDSE